MRLRATTGQATVEFVALLPLVAIVVALAWQAVVAGQAMWLAGGAARAAARAAAVGADPRAAGRDVLPRGLAEGLSVRRGGDGAVRVAIAIPSVVGHLDLGTVGARARFAPQG